MSFRQIDIDRLDPDSVVNDYPEVEYTGVTLDAVHSLAAQAKSKLQSGNVSGALQDLLAHPPYGSDDATKDVSLTAVLTALTSVRSAEAGPTIKQLNKSERMVLAKYLYKAMGTSQGQANGSILLAWLEALTAEAGHAPILNHITDRRTV